MARVFSNWLRAYVDYTEDLEAPERVHFWVGVSAIAGALRRRVWIEQPKFEWSPNFYIVLVGPPGIIGKSTSMSVGMDLLGAVKGVVFGPASITWQALGKDLEAAVEELVIGQGATLEKIPMSCLTIAISELGTFLKLDDDGLASMLIDMWDGQRSPRPWRHSTVASSKIEIQNPWLNIIGCTTPTWLRANFPEQMIGGGLTSRTLFVYADKKRRLIAYPSRVQLSGGVDRKLFRKGLINDLEEIAKLKGRIELTKGAMDWGEKWYEQLWTIRPPHLASDRFSPYISRKQTMLHKLAIILTAARDDSLQITEQHLIEADQLLSMNERDMLRVFESIGVVPEARHVGELSQFLRVHGELTSAKLWELCYTIMTMQDFKAALTSAIEAGVIEKRPAPPSSGSQFSLRLKTVPGGTST